MRYIRDLAAVLVAVSVVAPATASGQPYDDPPLPVEGIDVASLGAIKQASGLICGPTQGPGSDADNVNTDCDDVAPHNETAIAVNPTDPDNLIAGANDFQFLLTNGGALKITGLSRAHVSFDGGASWAMYGVPFKNYAITGDPAVAFDANGTAYYSILGAPLSQAISTEVNADVLVSHSADGGKTWSAPSRVAQGVGAEGTSASRARGDKEYITAWGDGNALVAWTNVVQDPGGSIVGLRIYDSVTHDGGVTWTKPTQVSSTADFCIGNPGEPHACDDFGAVPVYSGGHVYIAFANFSAADGHSQYLVSEVSPQTGALVAGPFQVAQLVDGNNAYPRSAFGRHTYQDSQFRTWALGNLAADTTNADHLAVVWSDMRNSTVPLPNLNPYDVTTNSDVVVSQSFDAGRTWSAPVALAIANDQFMPWAAYDSSGLLRIGYFDRSYDPANHQFGYSLATETGSGSLAFTSSQLTTQLSDPTKNNLWNSFIPVDPDFPRATQFLGDYSGIAADPNGGIVALWTDLRNVATFGSSSGFSQDVFFARSG